MQDTKRVRILVEMQVSKGLGMPAIIGMADDWNVPSFKVDEHYEPIPLGKTPATGQSIVVIRGEIDERWVGALEKQANVVAVWRDATITHFESKEAPSLDVLKDLDTCPFGTCDCDPTTEHGDLDEVARYLGVDQIWAAGYKGDGIVVGMVDGGITAEGRPVKQGETQRRVPQVIGGPASDWGTTAAAWSNHGNMTATDLLGIAPNVHIYDIRIASESVENTISTALSGFQWALDHYRRDGTPQVLSNSWGMYMENWGPDYATNPNHPFTRKVVDVLNEGILVLFAAGNCGGTCPGTDCGSDVGSGKSIWGANGHPRVITVGAVNKNEQLVGYSSTGPAALDQRKPDLCGITHFKGYTHCDNGTSAATPIVAGVLALIKQAHPQLSQEQGKALLTSTAKDIGPPGWDQYSGFGILRAKLAFDKASSLRASKITEDSSDKS